VNKKKNIYIIYNEMKVVSQQSH